MAIITEEVFTREYTASFLRTTKYLIGRYHMLPHDGEEIAQAAWARAWEKRDQYDGRASIYTWVSVIADRLWCDRLRIRRRRQVVALEAAASTLRYETAIENRIDAHTLYGCLSPLLAQAVWLYLEMGYSGEEAARITHSTDGAIKSRVFRAVHQMRAVAFARAA